MNKSGNMDLQAEKDALIEYITQIKEVSILKKFKELVKANETDWWDQISEEEREEINEGIHQAENGELISHEEVKKSYSKWL